MVRFARALFTDCESSGNLQGDSVPSDPTVREWVPSDGLMQRALRRGREEMLKSAARRQRRNRPPGFETFSDSRAASGAALAAELVNSDLIHLHWTAGFLDWSLLARPELSAKPVVFTLHDMNQNILLAIHRRSELFSSRRGNRRIAMNQFRHKSAHCLDTQRKRRHVKQ